MYNTVLNHVSKKTTPISYHQYRYHSVIKKFSRIWIAWFCRKGLIDIQARFMKEKFKPTAIS